MIPGFEKETCPLNDFEKSLVPIIIKGLSTKVGPDMAIHGAAICQKMSEAGKTLTEPRLRKIVNFIRSEGILPVIATSKGYYVSYDASVIETQIESLIGRRDAIDVSIKGLEKMLLKIKTNG